MISVGSQEFECCGNGCRGLGNHVGAPSGVVGVERGKHAGAGVFSACAPAS
jgi:hypothetical protein